MSDKPKEEAPEVKKKLFVTHIGHVTVNNYGAVEFEVQGAPAFGIPAQKVIWSVYTLRDLEKATREAIAEMRKEGVSAR